MSILQNDWGNYLEEEFQKPYYLSLRRFLIDEYQHYTIYPDMYHIYEALHRTPYARTKVVILGQDPYHQPGQAHGLSFSVREGVTPPPSLQNIFKELREDVGVTHPNHGYLGKWADQGVLLLNAVLTVRRGIPNSHRGKGWEQLTDQVIRILGQREEPTVFILWGKNAQEKEPFIDPGRHLIIRSAHPSPFSANRGFFGSHPFSRANRFLSLKGRGEIDWSL